jgi:hypothetical protein
MQVSENSLNFPIIARTTFQNLSNLCRHKYDPLISRFFYPNVWPVFDVWSNCGLVRTASATAGLPLPPKYEKANQDNRDTNEIE